MQTSRRQASLYASIAFLSALLAPNNSKAYDKTLDLPVEPKSLESKLKPPEDPPNDGEDKPPTIYGTEIKSENSTLFYVIDISGSMSYDMGQYTAPDGSVQTGNRLDRAKAELTRSIASLPENFKFNALAYDCSSDQWRPQLEKADPPNKESAIGWVAKLQPGGGTGTGPACVLALNHEEVRCVVLLTDGDPNCYLGSATGSFQQIEGHRSMIREHNKNKAIVNVYGIGATGQFKQFCQNVASDNSGTYTDVR